MNCTNNISNCTQENCIFVRQLPFDCSQVELENIFKSSQNLTAKVLILDKMSSGIEPKKKYALIMFHDNVAKSFLNGPKQYIRNLVKRNKNNGMVSNDYFRFMDSKIHPFRKKNKVKVSKKKKNLKNNKFSKNNFSNKNSNKNKQILLAGLKDQENFIKYLTNN